MSLNIFFWTEHPFLNSINKAAAIFIYHFTVLPTKSYSDVMLSLQSYRELRIDRSLVY